MKALGRFFIVCVLIISCSKPDNIKTGNPNDMSSFAKKFIGLNSSSNTTTLSAGNLNQSSNSAMSPHIPTISNTDSTSSDTTIIWSPGGDCANTFQITNPDGSTTVVTDYSNGCTITYDNCPTHYFGKSTYSYKNSYSKSGSVYSSSFYYQSLTKNFGQQAICNNDTSYWVSNGNSFSSGDWEYDTLNQTYQGSYTYNDSSGYTYGNTSYIYQGIGKTSYSNKKSITESLNYSYQNGSDYYQVNVTIPIVRDYNCNNWQSGGGVYYLIAISIPVSGHEVIKYSQNGTSGEFEIDYGNGNCDSLITIYENGTEYIVDLNKLPVSFGG
ncbi:MAG: hypothetical protein QM734_12040 [Cyclobacteriaceae bacterium]